ncbi:MAG TPA: hypothetical protein VFL66_09355 [Gaiellaceae bacterium]|nr:hypothetical protein [Gaiellaceae bacterium]
MTSTNPHLRAILIAAALAFTALALGWYTLNRQQSSAPPAAPVVVHHVAPVHAKAKAEPKPRPAAAPKAHAAAAAKPAVAPARPKPAKPARPAGPPPVVRAALAYGLPKPVAQQFAGHGVVVVSVYDPASHVDRMTEAEAQAGALLGGAGFVSVDATEDGPITALSKLLGILDVPSTLVFQRPDGAAVAQFAAAAAAAPAPGLAAVAHSAAPTPPEFKLFVTLSGYADQQTVGQAAQNADPDPGLPAHPTAWAKGANALCTTASSKLAAIGPLKTRAQLKQATPVYRKVGAAYLSGLRQLKVPAGSEQAVAQFLSLQSQDVSLTTRIAAATAKRDTVTAATLGLQEDAVSRQSSALAQQLGATACGQGL